MKWDRLLAGAVCASLLSVPVWAVEGGEAPAAGAGQTSSAACGVTLDGVCLDLSEAPAAPYQENGQVMLPLWKVAQALGWTVTWLPEENGTRIENEDQVMNLTYGLDRYACASKSSIGVTSPEHYGAAPVVVAGRTYVPASMFQLLSCTVTMEGGTVALRTEGAPPAEDEPPSGGAVEYQTAAEAEQAVGFPLKAPGELGAPEKIQVISGAVAQLNWPEGISYRVARGSQEVSGSYTAYGWERSQSAGEQMVTIKGNGDWTYLAAWKDGTYSHALAFEQGVSAQRAVSLVGDLVPLSGE